MSQTIADLAASFPGCGLIPVIIQTEKSEISFNELLVYSHLKFRGASGQKKIGQATGLQAERTVPTALRFLGKYGLVQRDEKKIWSALEPRGKYRDWFIWRADQFSYWSMAVPTEDCPLTLKRSAVYFKLWDMPKSSVRSLSRALKLSVKTVRAAVKKLQKIGLADELLNPRKPETKQLPWFRI